MLPSVEVDVAVSSSGIREKKEIERRAGEHEGGGGSIVVVVALKKHQLYPLFVAFSDVLYGLAWPF